MNEKRTGVGVAVRREQRAEGECKGTKQSSRGEAAGATKNKGCGADRREAREARVYVRTRLSNEHTQNNNSKEKKGERAQGGLGEELKRTRGGHTMKETQRGKEGEWGRGGAQ